MSPKQFTAIAVALLRVHVFKDRLPLFVAWNLTFRCNLSCRYCGTNDVKAPELAFEDVRRRLDELWSLGARWITFGGGEPLLREDAAEVFGYAKHKGYCVYLSTNGALAQRRQDALRSVDHVNLSLDGGREVHDVVRGRGAFDQAMEAVAVLKSMGVPTSFLCVLSRHNLDRTEQVLDIASQHKSFAMFQPARSVSRGLRQLRYEISVAR